MTEQTSTTPSRGKVLWHFTMSLDGFIAGPNGSMDWLSGLPDDRPGLDEELAATTGAILAGRRGFPPARPSRPATRPACPTAAPSRGRSSC